jgi:hypothetical protein
MTETKTFYRFIARKKSSWVGFIYSSSLQPSWGLVQPVFLYGSILFLPLPGKSQSNPLPLPLQSPKPYLRYASEYE